MLVWLTYFITTEEYNMDIEFILKIVETGSVVAVVALFVWFLHNKDKMMVTALDKFNDSLDKIATELTRINVNNENMKSVIQKNTEEHMKAHEQREQVTRILNKLDQ